MLVLKKVVGDPILTLKNRVKDLAGREGDLASKVVITSQDEIGEVGECINKFLKKTQEIIISSKKSAHEVKVTDNRLNANVKDISNSAKKYCI